MSSDYFGALLRSAGLPAAGGATVEAPGQAPGADLVEIDVERDATEAPVQPRPVPQQPASPARRPADRTPRAATAAPPPPPPPGLRAAAPRPAARDAPAASPDGVAPAPPPLHTAVQAALAWVASDPQGRADAGAGLREPGATPPAATGIDEVALQADALAPVRHGADDDDAPGSTRHDIDGIEGIDDIDDGSPPAATAAVPAGRPAPRPATQRRAREPAPAPREERVEITIGAIHLHVDAPAPAAAAVAPAPAPPSAAPSLRTPTPRSALSRRALYRL